MGCENVGGCERKMFRPYKWVITNHSLLITNHKSLLPNPATAAR